MFEDQISNNPTKPAASPITGGVASLPSAASVKDAPGTVDIFSEADKTSAPVKPAIGPRTNMMPPLAKRPEPPVGPPDPLSQLPDDLDDDSVGSKKLFWIGLIFLVVILAAGGYWAYAKFFTASQMELPALNLNLPDLGNANQSADNANLNQNVNQSAELNQNQNANQSNNNANSLQVQNEEVNLDSDKDGLTDAQEKLIGSNPNNPDSDGDGLFDREEVQFYHTDPLNPDSDGDGYLDGAEVKSGYNPNGSGKLLDSTNIK